MMVGTTRRLSVYAYRQPCDMRKSFEALSALVLQSMGKDLLSGEVFLFVGKSRKRAKALYFDGTGLCLFTKRLERGRFAALWERAEAGAALQMTHSELTLFLEGSQLVGRTALAPAAATLQPVFAQARAAGGSGDLQPSG